MNHNLHAKLKVGFVFDDTLDNPDGVQQYIFTLGKWLANQGHDVRYLAGETKTHSHNPHVYSLSKNVHVRFNKNRLSIPLPAKKQTIQEVLDKEQFDILHVQLPCSPMLGSRIVSLADPQTAIIGTFHVVGNSGLETIGAKVLGRLQKKTLARFDTIVSVSDAAAAFALEHFDIRSNVLPNVVDYETFHKGKRLAHLDDGKINIIFLGRLVERKGCRYLIEAVRRLRDRHKADNLRVLICGKGPLESELRELVRKYELTHLVQFVGFVSEEDKPNYYASADFAIFPSTGGESFGIVLVEAMAAGSGVVMGGDNPGYRSVLGAQGNHVLFDPRSTNFADKIELLLSNSELRDKIHTWQEQEVKRYAVDVVGKKLLIAYEKIVDIRQNEERKRIVRPRRTSGETPDL